MARLQAAEFGCYFGGCAPVGAVAGVVRSSPAGAGVVAGAFGAAIGAGAAGAGVPLTTDARSRRAP